MRSTVHEIEVTPKINDLPPLARTATLARLDELSGDNGLSAERRAAIWEALRAKAAQHREFTSAAWALPSDEVGAIETTAARFEPTDPIERYRWLFKEHVPILPSIKRSDNFGEYDALLAKTRANAAADLVDATDWASLRRFASSTELSWIVGTAIAQARRYEHESEFLGLLGSSDYHDANFAAGYFSERFQDGGWSWLQRYLNSGEQSPDQAARLLLYTNDYSKAWEVAEEIGEPVAAVFWRHFRTNGLGGAFTYVDLVADRLLAANRPGSALDLIMLYSPPEDSMSRSRVELVARGLEALLGREAGDAEVKLLSHYSLTELFSTLERSELPRERVARLEWSFLPSLGIDGRPVALTTMLSRDPNFFVDIIRSIYRPRDCEDAEDSEAEKDVSDDTQRAAIAINAYRLLSEWKGMPGQREDRTVKSEALEAWVTDARAKLRESGHIKAGDTHIGHVLAWGPTDADGSRPCLEVRNMLEGLQSVDVEDGLRNELHNRRGVTTRGVFDGGDQERAVAASYFEQSEKFADRWPCTAALLRKLGESYEWEARQMDNEAERRRKGFDS